MEIVPRPWRHLEIILAAAILAASLVYVVLTAHAMATTSLSTDEFGTIGTFSSRGPLRVITDYRAPKNHIFFNLLNSLLPARDSLEPVRARAVSILATGLTALLIAIYAARRGRWIEGAALVAIWVLAPETLTLSMEARGYGFLGLFAVIASIATLEYQRTTRRHWLVALVLSSVLGVYTIPSFLFFVGPLLALQWLVKRDRATFAAGAVTGLLILLLYAPVLPQLASAFGQYQTSDEAEFNRLSSLWKAVRLFVFPGSDVEMALLLATLGLAPIALFRWQSAERPALVLLAVAGAIYFAILLVLKTPPLRVAAFGFLPVMIAGTFALGTAVRRLTPPVVRLTLGLAVAATLLVSLTRAIRNFDFLPTENWSLSGHAIDVAFPASVKVDFRRFAKYLAHTLPAAETRSASFDAAKFADGTLVVVEAGNKWADAVRFTAPPGRPPALQWTIPGRIRDMVLSFHRPAGSAVDGLPALLADGDGATAVPLAGSGVTWRFTSPAPAHALVLLLNRPVTDRQLIVRANIPGAFLAGNAVVLPLTSHRNEPVEISLNARGGGFAISEAWIAR